MARNTMFTSAVVLHGTETLFQSQSLVSDPSGTLDLVRCGISAPNLERLVLRGFDPVYLAPSSLHNLKHLVAKACLPPTLDTLEQLQLLEQLELSFPIRTERLLNRLLALPNLVSLTLESTLKILVLLDWFRSS